MDVLVTGAAGFIGYHLCNRLLERSTSVVGIDNFNSYYDPTLKRARENNLYKKAKETGTLFKMVEASIENKDSIEEIFLKYKPKKVINLAAQAGVRYSLINPSAYIQSNLVGFGLILEGCRNHGIEHLVYASSSSVYGGNVTTPFSEKQGVNHPVSLYGASKKANELMAHSYSHLYDMPTTGLRFFTVYGPWGRPDMALFLFTKAILENESLKIFNNGEMVRDFTYIDDIVESLIRVIDKPPNQNNNFDKNAPDPSLSWAPYKIFNIGNSRPMPLMDYVEAIESALGRKAKKEFLPMQPGDVEKTHADTTSLESWTGFKPNTPIKDGVSKFIDWYLEFYSLEKT